MSTQNIITHRYSVYLTFSYNFTTEYGHYLGMRCFADVNMSLFRNKTDKKIRKIQNHNEIRTTQHTQT